MDLALIGGDNSDNQQENENTWVRQLLEGGQTLDPNSGIADYSACTPQQRADLAKRPADEASRYTGLQDYDDYNDGAGDGNFYDPDPARGRVRRLARRTRGLMDAAQRPFVAAGLRNGAAPVPTYLANGNHDGAVQGYVSATQSADARGHRLLQALHQQPRPPTRRPARCSPRPPASRCRPTRAGGSWTGPRSSASTRRATSATRTGSGSWTRPRTPPRPAPPPTTRGRRRRACASSRWTPSPRAPAPAAAPRATWTTPSTSGCAASCAGPRPPSSWWWCSATTRSGG